jgi:hypothetical protein
MKMCVGRWWQSRLSHALDMAKAYECLNWDRGEMGLGLRRPSLPGAICAHLTIMPEPAGSLTLCGPTRGA